VRSAARAAPLGVLLVAVLGLGTAAAVDSGVPSSSVVAQVQPAAALPTVTVVGSVRRTTTTLNARGHPVLSSKVLFMVAPGTAVRVYRRAVDSQNRVWYLVHVRSRPGWIAGWLTKAVVVRRAAAWHPAMASSFGVGDGLLGNGMACGSRLTSSVMAVANRTLKCGTRVRIRIGGSIVVAKVMDRGPYVSGRTFDLSPAVCHALRSCNGVFRIEWQLAH
jgi:hypothetical protein